MYNNILWDFRGFSLFLMLLLFRVRICTACPVPCHCSTQFVWCDPGLIAIPTGIPGNAIHLRLSGTFLTRNSIPRIRRNSFASLSALQRLHVTFSDIQDIEDGAFSGMSNLKELDLANNKINKIVPETLQGLSRLEKLELTGNEKCLIDQSVFSLLPELQELYLGQLNLRFIDRNFMANLPNLKLLDLHGNNIAVLETDSFLPMASLKHLDLAGNMLKAVPVPLQSHFSRLQSIKLDSNPWHCNCEMTPFKHLTNISSSVICSTPDNLKYFDVINIEDSKLKCLPPQNAACLKSSFSVLVSESIDMSCNVSGGDPQAWMVWVTPNGEHITHKNNTNVRFIISQNGSMYITNADMTDDGTWTLIGTNGHGRDLKVNINVHVEYPTTTVPTTETSTTKPTTTTERTTSLPSSTTTTSRPSVTTTQNRPTASNNSSRASKRAVNNNNSINYGLIIAAAGITACLTSIIWLVVVYNKCYRRGDTNKVGRQPRREPRREPRRRPHGAWKKPTTTLTVSDYSQA